MTICGTTVEPMTSATPDASGPARSCVERADGRLGGVALSGRARRRAATWGFLVADPSAFRLRQDEAWVPVPRRRRRRG